MNVRHRFMKAVFMSMLVGMLASSAALAKSGFGSNNPSSETIILQDAAAASEQCDSNDQGAKEHQESDDQGQGESQESGSEESESESESEACDATEDQSSGDQSSGDSGSGNRGADCREAAGMGEPPAGGTEGEGEGDDVKQTGLDHAIATVLANCIKNPQAPGLLNALRHLVANKARHEAHDAEKEARRAAHEAAKAEREALKGSHGKGSDA
jgi:hypothetical protein